MGRHVPLGVAFAGAVLLQVTLAPYLSIGGVVPNFMLILVVTMALAAGPNEGALVGFAAGLVFDLLGSGAVGPMALVLSIIGFVAGLIHGAMFAEGWLLPLTVLALAALATEVAYALLMLLLGFDSAVLPLALRTVAAAVYNTVSALLVYAWLARFLRRERPVKTFRRLA